MTKCISCDSLLDPNTCEIGNQYPSAVYLKPELDDSLYERSSLDLAICSNSKCRLVQLSHILDLSFVYREYPYQTGTTATMGRELKDFIDSSLKQIDLQKGDVILDIGGNDGTLLSNFQGQGYKLVNIDVASDINQVFASPDYNYINSKFSRAAYHAITNDAPKCIFSSAVFYQVQDLMNFCEDIKQIMNNDTVFFLQMSYVGSMYQNNVFDNVVHEHISYFSLFSLHFLVSRFGLRIISAEIIPLYGGSLRVSIVRESSTKFKVDASVGEILRIEQQLRLNDPIKLMSFGEQFKMWKIEARQTYSKLVDDFGFVIGFGASTKGNMILQALDINSNTMKYIVDNNQKKIGTITMGSRIPIVSESNFRPDSSAIMLLPYYYKDYFIARLGELCDDNAELKIFIPLPKPEVLYVRRT